MGHATPINDSLVISDFHTALLRQLLVVLAVVVGLAVAWNATRSARYRRQLAATRTGEPGPGGPLTAMGSEPVAHRVLRIGFGLIWLLDGLLQLQQSMPLGMPPNVLQPAAAGAPGWVQSVVNVGVTIWSEHPVAAAASVVWIQCGIGVLLLVTPRGRWQRLAGLAVVGWGLVVWVFGEAFGGIFTPGATVLFGLPGAALVYVVAGALLALPERSWHGRRLGRRLLAGTGVFLIAMAVLQAWPGRGFWQGHLTHGAAGSFAAMVNSMATTSQPHVTASAVSAFGSFDTAHGWAVNLFVVVVLAAIGVALCTGRPAVVRWAGAAAVVLFLADWLLVEDLGFFGGTGTDPNSMVPLALLVAVGYLALAHAPAGADVPAHAEVAPPAPAEPWWSTMPAPTLTRVTMAVGAIAVILVGVVPMTAAAVNRQADPVVAEANDGPPVTLDTPAPGFTLTNQYGRPTTLRSLRGDVVALTFLDPVCTSDCPVIAQELRQADLSLGSAARHVEFVAVVTNPLYNSVATIDAFDRQEALTSLPNWLYLTGSAHHLNRVLADYGVEAEVAPAGAMVAHSEEVVVIDASGRQRVILDADPPPGSIGVASFSALTADEITSVLGQ
jgi:cytochrome oxidase Cu insertion factor (SCO1/SenC/PrrC family)